MEKVVFEGKECYIAYKVLNDNLLNFKKNYTYELNNWYKTFDVDMSNDTCSYGCNLFQDIEFAFNFMSSGKIFKCFVPIKNNKIKFIDEENKFRCLRFYLTDEEVFLDYIKNYEKYWSELTENQRNCVCSNNNNFNYKKYWSELTKNQRCLVCSNNNNFNYEKYWSELTKNQRNCVCSNNNNFNYEKYWSELTENQRNCVCRNINNSNFNYKRYWSELTEKQKDFIKKNKIKKCDY
jgi:hypothetical protein